MEKDKMVVKFKSGLSFSSDSCFFTFSLFLFE